jgi:hypothetical protein
MRRAIRQRWEAIETKARETAHTATEFWGGCRVEPLEQDEDTTLEAELRQALQHQRAAIEQARETQAHLERLIALARVLLKGPPASERPLQRHESDARRSPGEDSEIPG